jgi:hypothetical protein
MIVETADTEHAARNLAASIRFIPKFKKYICKNSWITFH